VTALGNITPRHPFLGSIREERGGIGIDDSAVAHVQALEKLGAKFVVGSSEAAQRLRIEAQQKRPQRVAMRKIVQAQQRWDESLVNQALSVLDAPQSGYNGKNMGQKKIGGMKVPVIVLGPTHRELKKVPNCKSTTEGLEQIKAAKASEPAFFKGEMKLSQASGHSSQSYLIRKFVRRPEMVAEARCSHAIAVP
jgi:hypothetical protein